ARKRNIKRKYTISRRARSFPAVASCTRGYSRQSRYEYVCPPSDVETTAAIRPVEHNSVDTPFLFFSSLMRISSLLNGRRGTSSEYLQRHSIAGTGHWCNLLPKAEPSGHADKNHVRDDIESRRPGEQRSRKSRIDSSRWKIYSGPRSDRIRDIRRMIRSSRAIAGSQTASVRHFRCLKPD
ncbi:hypothetical protein ALC57_07823, partial [Trachymyrmex cornetzi]